jgi:hypothetical protein
MNLGAIPTFTKDLSIEQMERLIACYNVGSSKPLSDILEKGFDARITDYRDAIMEAINCMDIFFESQYKREEINAMEFKW